MNRRLYDLMYRWGAPWEGGPRSELVDLVEGGELTPERLPPGRAVDLGCGSGANAVYLAQEFLESTRNPSFEGVIAYGRRAEHCWNGDASRPNAESRLRYHQMFIPRAVERMVKTAPSGADLESWRY